MIFRGASPWMDKGTELLASQSMAAPHQELPAAVPTSS